MNRFTIGGGLYAPLEVDIDGKIFTVRKINRAVIGELDAIQQDYQAKIDGLEDVRKTYAALERAYAELRVMLGEDAKDAIESLDIREASELMTFITQRVMNPEKKAGSEEREKNGPKPGDATAP